MQPRCTPCIALGTAKGKTGGFSHPSPCALPVGERVQRTAIPFAVLENSHDAERRATLRHRSLCQLHGKTLHHRLRSARDRVDVVGPGRDVFVCFSWPPSFQV